MRIIEQPKGRSLSKTRAETIDNILSFLFLSEEKTDWSWIERQDQEGGPEIAKFNRLPLTHFDGANVSTMYESLLDTTSYEILVYFPSDENGDPTDECKQDLLSLPHVWDTRLAGYFDEVPAEFPEVKATYLFSMLRYRTVPLKEVRGLFRLRSSFVVETSQAHLFNDGTYRSSREYVQYFGGKWHCVGIPFELIKPEPVDTNGQRGIWLSRARAMTDEYDWRVHIGFNRVSIPTVSLPTDPLSSREVFKLRDVPAGKSRREALKHWVSGHVRKSVEPGYAETYIWPYLRGAEEFTWQGLYCKIQPSEYDLKKAAQYQKIRGKHAGLVV